MDGEGEPVQGQVRPRDHRPLGQLLPGKGRFQARYHPLQRPDVEGTAVFQVGLVLRVDAVVPGVDAGHPALAQPVGAADRGRDPVPGGHLFPKGARLSPEGGNLGERYALHETGAVGDRFQGPAKVVAFVGQDQAASGLHLAAQQVLGLFRQPADDEVYEHDGIVLPFELADGLFLLLFRARTGDVVFPVVPFALGGYVHECFVFEVHALPDFHHVAGAHSGGVPPHPLDQEQDFRSGPGAGLEPLYVGGFDLRSDFVQVGAGVELGGRLVRTKSGIEAGEQEGEKQGAGSVHGSNLLLGDHGRPRGCRGCPDSPLIKLLRRGGRKGRPSPDGGSQGLRAAADLEGRPATLRGRDGLREAMQTQHRSR